MSKQTSVVPEGEGLETVGVRDRAVQIARFLEDQKASEVCVLDISASSSFADCFVIASAQSHGHMRGLVKNLNDALHDMDVSPKFGKRGINDDETWSLIDCGDFIVHIMTKEAREFYDLEKVWFTSPPIEFAHAGK